MEIEKSSQSIPLKSFDSRSQWLPINVSTLSESDEGGLNLGQTFMTLRRRLPTILGVTVVVTAVAVLKSITSAPTYQSSFEILTKPVTVESKVLSSVPQSFSNDRQEQQTDAEKKQLDQTKLKLLKSPALLNPIVESLRQKYTDVTFDSLFGDLAVASAPGSEILSVSYRDPSRQKVKDVIKLVSAAYLNYSLEERLADVRQGIEFVNAQIPQLQARVTQGQDRLQKFRQQYNLLDPGSAGRQLDDQITRVGQQQLEAQVKLSESRSLQQDLTRQIARKAGESAASLALRDNKRYQDLQNKLLEVETEIAKKQAVFRKDSSPISLLENQRQNIAPLLEREGQRVQREVENEVQQLQARNQILLDTQNSLAQRVKQLSTVSRQYEDIQLELKIATENLNQFLGKREALRIEAGQKKTPWQILTPPADAMPVSSSLKRTGILGAILGLLIGVAIALLLEKLSNVLHTAEEVRDISKLPVLAEIPFTPEPMRMLGSAQRQALSPEPAGGLVHQMRNRLGREAHPNPYMRSASPFLEAFRSLDTNIRLLNPDAPIRSFAISSASAQEGKSTIATYLAQAAAALGQRVLLVDTDLRRPQLHHRLELLNTYGLSNLVSSEVEVEQVIQQSLTEPNLFILTAGQIPPDPTRLISSKRMQTLMQQFEESYDLVIYDTPPVLGLADAKLVATKTDGIMLVVGLDKTRTASLKQTLDDLKLSSVTPLGIVATGTKERSNHRIINK